MQILLLGSGGREHALALKLSQSTLCGNLFIALVYLTPFIGGLLADRYLGYIKSIFIGGTLLKAGFIVMSFMHLGHEVKQLRYVIIAPYVFFIIYLSGIALNEGVYSKDTKATMDKNVLEHSMLKGAEATPAATAEHH